MTQLPLRRAGRVLAAVLAVPLGLSAVSASAQAQNQQLRLATVVTAPHPWIDAAEAMKAEVEERTEGRVTIEIFPSGQLGSDQTVIDEMRIGTVDLIIGGVQNAAPFVRKYEIFGLNYMFDGMDSFRKATDAEGPVFQYFQEEVSNAGVGLELLALTGGGTRNLSTNTGPVTTPDDLDGVRMRVPGSEMDARMWQAVGALTTSLPWTEIYSGVQTGVVGAFESTISGYYGSKLFEVAPYHAKTEHQIMMSHISISEIAFNRLSEEDRAILAEAAQAAGELGTTKGEEYDSELLDRLANDHGVTVTEVEKQAFIDAVAPLHDEVAASIDATELLEMIRSLQ